MDISNPKLKDVLYKLIENDFQFTNDHLDTLLNHITEKLKHVKQGDSSVILITDDDDEDDENDERFHFLSTWLKKALQSLINTKVSPSGVAFIINLAALICSEESVFHSINFEKVLPAVRSYVNQTLNVHRMHSDIILSCVKLFSSFLDHKSGLEWMISNNVLSFLRNVTFERPPIVSCPKRSVSREVFKLVARLYQKCKNCNKVFFVTTAKCMLAPLNGYLTNTNISHKDLRRVLHSMWFMTGVLEEILEHCCFLVDFEVILILNETCSFEKTIRSALAVVTEKALIVKLNNILFILTFFDLARYARGTRDKMREAIIQFGKTLIEAANTATITSVLKLCFLGHTYFAAANSSGLMVHNKKCNRTFQHQILLLQFMPALCSPLSLVDIQSTAANQEETRQQLVTSFLKQVFPTTIRIYISWKNHLDKRSLFDAIHALRYILDSRKYLTRDQANLTTQMLIHLFNDYNEIRRKNPENMPQSHEVYAEILLETLIAYIKEFHLTGSDSVEAVSLLETAFEFLGLVSNCTKLEIKGLQLINIAIANYMSPSMILLIDDISDSIITLLGPLITTKLTHDDCNVKQSALEVVQTITFNSNKNFPSFREIVLKENYPSLVFHMATQISKTPLRITAFKCLQELASVDDYRETLLKNGTIFSQLIHVLCTDPNYTIRTEVVALFTFIYDQDIHKRPYSFELHTVMLNVLQSERNRQVKIAILDYWLKVINIVLSTQGMIDGSFPDVTFCKELKRIITFDKTKIKSCLLAVLTELSRNGCLEAFVFTLRQETDPEVCQTAEGNLHNLIDILIKYDINTIDTIEMYLDSLSYYATPINFNGILSPAMSPLEPTDLDSLEVEEFYDSDRMLTTPGGFNNLSSSSKNVSPNEFLSFINQELNQCKSRHKESPVAEDDIESLLNCILKVK